MDKWTLPEKVYVVYTLYTDGSHGVESVEFDKEEAVRYCRQLRDRRARFSSSLPVYIEEYTQESTIIVL